MDQPEVGQTGPVAAQADAAPPRANAETKARAAQHFAEILMGLREPLIRQTMWTLGCNREVAEDAFMDVARTFLADLERMDISELSDDFMSWPRLITRWKPAYITDSVYNAGRSILRRKHAQPMAPDDMTNISSATSEPASEHVDDALDAVELREAIRTTLKALIERGQTRKRGTFISPAQFESYREAMARGDGEAVEASDKKASQRRDQNVSRARAALVRTRYVVGVLGGRGWLLSPKRINETLDILDRSGPEPNKVLRDASTYVTTREREGTRVMEDDYAAAHEQDASATSLHRYEAELITDVGSTEPNCVLICEEHTRDPQRVTEF